ncbi:hypothetical protein M0R72_17250 [Candidatus Pacearchaeota archaeon]|jgi:hypothetical protein|nr:hypothetical protein [Candidatus Pacearchaeota archaeon]
MATYVTPYCQIHGYDFSDIIFAEGVDSSGGGHGVEEVQVPGRNYADVRSKGRAVKKYKIRTVKTKDRELLEAFLKEVNTAPAESEFYPFDATRAGYIALAHAYLSSGQALDKNLYEAIAEITCREAWLYGPDQGIDMQWTAPLPSVSALLTNAGQERAPISYLQASADRVAAYIEDLSVRITPASSSAEHDRELILCEKMLRGDIFELGWRGEVWHSYESPLISMAALSYDCHSKTSGGSIASGVLTLDNSDYVLMPFYGPLPVSGEAGAAKIELTVDALTGDGATVWKATETDLADLEEVDHDDLVVGNNVIYIPDVEGEEHVAFGIKAAASGSVAISALKGTVHRYVAPSKIPYSDPDETFKIRIESAAGNQLRFVQACINDRFWY